MAEVSKSIADKITDRSPTFGIAASKPEPGQQIFLYSYALDPNPQNGIYGVVKPIAMYKTIKEAEDRLLVEVAADVTKTFKIGNTGEYFLLKDPAALEKQQFDKVVDVRNDKDKQVAKRIIAAQNVRIKNVEDQDKKDIEEQEKQLRREQALEEDPNADKFTYEQYCILQRKLIENPAQCKALSANVELMVKEIQKLKTRHEQNIKDAEAFDKMHPEFKDKLAKDLETYRNIQRGRVEA